MSARERQVGGNHYNKHSIQPWDVIDEYSMSFYSGCALKYLLRTKGGKASKIEDLQKAIHCIEKEIECIDASIPETQPAGAYPFPPDEGLAEAPLAGALNFAVPDV